MLEIVKREEKRVDGRVGDELLEGIQRRFRELESRRMESSPKVSLSEVSLCLLFYCLQHQCGKCHVFFIFYSYLI